MKSYVITLAKVALTVLTVTLGLSGTAGADNGRNRSEREARSSQEDSGRSGDRENRRSGDRENRRSGHEQDDDDDDDRGDNRDGGRRGDRDNDRHDDRDNNRGDDRDHPDRDSGGGSQPETPAPGDNSNPTASKGLRVSANQDRAGSTDKEDEETAARLPERLAAYKAAYLHASEATAERQRYLEQYDAVSQMSEPDFLKAFPRGDYQATLDHLAERVRSYEAEAEKAAQDVAERLEALTEGQELTEEQLAELHHMLGL